MQYNTVEGRAADAKCSFSGFAVLQVASVAGEDVSDRSLDEVQQLTKQVPASEEGRFRCPGSVGIWQWAVSLHGFGGRTASS